MKTSLRFFYIVADIQIQASCSCVETASNYTGQRYARLYGLSAVLRIHITTITNSENATFF